jgi:hypothetical protein
LPFRRLFGLLFYLAICTLIAGAAIPGDDATPVPTTSGLADGTETLWNLPVVERVAIPQPDLSAIEIAPPHSNCSVAPLPELLDAEAISFENEEGPNTGGLLPAMAQALEKFRKLVTSAGGTFDLKSAYRPLAYQEHLQQVWFKWMRELRFNRLPGCQALRTQVNEEFTRHKLMPTQMPVTDSDHTRGMAFDAAVFMPRPVHTTAKKRRVTVSLDRLALMAGLKRPDIRRDPVHFKLVIISTVRTPTSE